MLSKKSLLIFPTQRAIREYLNKQKDLNTLLPSCLSIDDFLKKSIYFENKVYCDEEQRTLILNESVKNVDIKKLGISSNFTKFLSQSEYIYRFFLEISSEDIEIKDIKTKDTYEFYIEHLSILEQILLNYKLLLEKNNFVDRVNLKDNYRINIEFLDLFEDIIIYFEGYFTKIEFEIIEKISEKIPLKIEFFSNIYNQKSLQVFKSIGYDIKLNNKYILNLSKKNIIEENSLEISSNNIDIKAFSSRLNQISYIKSSIVSCVNKGIKAENIAVILPDESFAKSLELFDRENYFNFAMGKSILNKNLYQKANAIYGFLVDNEIKNIENLNFFDIDKVFIEKNIGLFWNKQCNEDKFLEITNYIKVDEKCNELIEKYDELVFRLKIVLFSQNFELKLKDAFKIFLQKLAKITLDDIHSGKVTVMGVLETRLISFDAVIICDFNDEFVPKISTKDKFLSTKIKSLANLPTKFDRENLQKYYYRRLIDNSKNVFISFVNKENSQISRFASELFDRKIDFLSNDEAYKDILYKNIFLNYSDENIEQNIDLTKISWSASSLKKFLDCRRKYYLENILRLKNHSISLLPENFELGSIVHKILEELIKSEGRRKKDLDELFLKYKNANPFLVLDLEVYRQKLYDFLEFENSRINIKTIDLEKNFTTYFNGISINGVIDRVDLNGDIYELIDYKTSRNLTIDTEKTYEKSHDFQLEFYYIAAKELYKSDKIKAYYFSLYDTLLKEEIVLDEKLELLNSIFSELKELSKEKIQFLKTENRAICEFCNFKIICNR
ncbi:AddAB recombination complex, helicase AddB [Aliarcobacter faecis]|uniref:PD-(D/E)XK nuclease family protein n=1 Tax=Aliarcobacter faecis TaxID=1564138 RepID=UPI00047AE959|nr:PD-(D/E)XK nuclease family protein [Aliarcobacter faecis]QKF72460.1 AddAB recombination complex, helicase AddB [Aliarcobacter faecis]